MNIQYNVYKIEVRNRKKIRKFFNTKFIFLDNHSIVSNIRAYDKAVLMQWNSNTVTMRMTKQY